VVTGTGKHIHTHYKYKIYIRDF